MKKEDLFKDLSKELVKIRADRGENQDYVENFGVSLKYYQKLESPKVMKNPSLWILYCLAKAFKVSIVISPKGVQIKD
ncbi:hypothetical protein K1X76_10870 [bacterium]|nr:hypothetical protein [bacterium]